MKSELEFASIQLLRADIAEVIVHDGIEISLAMVEDYHAYLIEKLKAPFSLLVNKCNSYSYTFEAQQHIGNIPQINCMAVVVYNEVQNIATNVLDKGVPREDEWKLRIFYDRKPAYDWLVEQQESVSKL